MYEVAGGAALPIADCSPLGGCADAVLIDPWDITNAGVAASGLTLIPVDGTVVEGLPSTNCWTFKLGGLLATSSASDAVEVDDSSLSTFPLDSSPTFTSDDSTSFVVGNMSSFRLAATGVPTATFAETGALPNGVALSTTGALSGTPAAGTAGKYPITITASNGISPDATQNFTLTVLPMGITTTSLPPGTVKTKYAANLTAVGGNPPYKWSLVNGSSPLPKGLKLSSKGVISGKPKKAGTYSFTVQVVDTKTKTKPHTQNKATQALSITIS
jgi:hypothetical protein